MSEASESSHEAALARYRDEIERIDDEIIALLAQRLNLGRQTGVLKREAGLPIHDPARESAVIRHVREAALEAGLPADDVRALFEQIVTISRRVQEQG